MKTTSPFGSHYRFNDYSVISVIILSPTECADGHTDVDESNHMVRFAALEALPESQDPCLDDVSTASSFANPSGVFFGPPQSV